MDDRAFEPSGFDPENFVSTSDATALVGQMHPTARPLSVRKFIIGAAIHDNESGLTGFATRFEESFHRFDRSEPSIYRARPESVAAIPTDFWRIGMAINEEAAGCFFANNFGHETVVEASVLPYRMRDAAYGELQNERVSLVQMAWGVHFPKHRLIALANDPEWQAWGGIVLAVSNRGRRGRPEAWKWDEVKAALTIEASQRPEILQGGAAPIVQFINDEMRWRHYEQLPEAKEVYAYARRFSSLWADPDPGPPAN